jgi:excisionase family DNA binding protein
MVGRATEEANEPRRGRKDGMEMSGSRERRPAETLNAAQPPTCERLWTYKDVSEFLGVPVGTLYQWRVRGEGPPAFKIGGHVRFDPDRVRAWVERSVA